LPSGSKGKDTLLEKERHKDFMFLGVATRQTKKPLVRPEANGVRPRDATATSLRKPA
jgi:hypothetical protein